MTAKYEIEFSEPVASHCACCGGFTVRLTRFVSRNGDAFAVYYAMYSNNHPEHLIAFLVSIGEWGDDSQPEQRSSFYCRVRPVDGSYEARLEDAAGSPWGDVDLLGRKLSRDEALRHPLKATAFELLDEALDTDPSLVGFLRRVECGDAAAPLERSFQAPDEIFALGHEREKRAVVGHSFASLDDRRFFIRCLLPRHVEHYGTWHIGLWVEISQRDYDHAKAVWDDASRYSQLRLTGVMANDAKTSPRSYDLPVTLGMPVEVRVVDPNHRPYVDASATGELASVLAKPWDKQAFEKFAVGCGLL